MIDALVPSILPFVAYAQGFAIAMHRERKYGDLPYHYHLMEVEETLKRFGYHSQDLLAAAWLHDLLEECGDSAILRDMIKDMFGYFVFTLVTAVTDEYGANRKERKAKTYPKIRAAGTDAVVLKLADRIANVEASIGDCKAPMTKMYREEQPEFRAALYREGECEDMWRHLADLLRLS